MSEEIAFFCSILVTYILYLHHKLYMLKKEFCGFIDFLLSDDDKVKNTKESKNANH
jgi:hypothetical protein